MEPKTAELKQQPENVLTVNLGRVIQSPDKNPIMAPSKKDPKKTSTFKLRDVLKEILIKWTKDFDNSMYTRERSSKTLEMLYSSYENYSMTENEKLMRIELFNHLGIDNIIVWNFLDELK